ncbi:MAG: hypothetical protein JSR76_07060 [Verrucomicrobia bacterium]|nr:hypothetical protein [Verrucomicrobiota bacterium]
MVLVVGNPVPSGAPRFSPREDDEPPRGPPPSDGTAAPGMGSFLASLRGRVSALKGPLLAAGGMGGVAGVGYAAMGAASAVASIPALPGIGIAALLGGAAYAGRNLLGRTALRGATALRPVVEPRLLQAAAAAAPAAVEVVKTAFKKAPEVAWAVAFSRAKEERKAAALEAAKTANISREDLTQMLVEVRQEIIDRIPASKRGQIPEAAEWDEDSEWQKTLTLLPPAIPGAPQGGEEARGILRGELRAWQTFCCVERIVNTNKAGSRGSTPLTPEQRGIRDQVAGDLFKPYSVVLFGDLGFDVPRIPLPCFGPPPPKAATTGVKAAEDVSPEAPISSQMVHAELIRTATVTQLYATYTWITKLAGTRPCFNHIPYPSFATLIAEAGGLTALTSNDTEFKKLFKKAFLKAIGDCTDLALPYRSLLKFFVIALFWIGELVVPNIAPLLQRRLPLLLNQSSASTSSSSFLEAVTTACNGFVKATQHAGEDASASRQANIAAFLKSPAYLGTKYKSVRHLQVAFTRHTLATLIPGDFLTAVIQRVDRRARETLSRASGIRHFGLTLLFTPLFGVFSLGTLISRPLQWVLHGVICKGLELLLIRAFGFCDTLSNAENLLGSETGLGSPATQTLIALLTKLRAVVSSREPNSLVPLSRVPPLVLREAKHALKSLVLALQMHGADTTVAITRVSKGETGGIVELLNTLGIKGWPLAELSQVTEDKLAELLARGLVTLFEDEQMLLKIGHDAMKTTQAALTDKEEDSSKEARIARHNENLAAIRKLTQGVVGDALKKLFDAGPNKGKVESKKHVAELRKAFLEKRAEKDSLFDEWENLLKTLKQSDKNPDLHAKFLAVEEGLDLLKKTWKDPLAKMGADQDIESHVTDLHKDLITPFHRALIEFEKDFSKMLETAAILAENRESQAQFEPLVDKISKSLTAFQKDLAIALSQDTEVTYEEKRAALTRLETNYTELKKDLEKLLALSHSIKDTTLRNLIAGLSSPVASFGHALNTATNLVEMDEAFSKLQKIPLELTRPPATAGKPGRDSNAEIRRQVSEALDTIFPENKAVSIREIDEVKQALLASVPNPEDFKKILEERVKGLRDKKRQKAHANELDTIGKLLDTLPKNLCKRLEERAVLKESGVSKESVAKALETLKTAKEKLEETQPVDPTCVVPLAWTAVSEGIDFIGPRLEPLFLKLEALITDPAFAGAVTNSLLRFVTTAGK